MGTAVRRAQDAGAANKGRRKILRKVSELKKQRHRDKSKYRNHLSPFGPLRPRSGRARSHSRPRATQRGNESFGSIRKRAHARAPPYLTSHSRVRVQATGPK